MSGPSITYEAPKIEKDDTFEKYLQYQQQRQFDLDQRAQDADDRRFAQTRRRREIGANQFDAFSKRLQSQVERGFTSYDNAQQQLADYIADYDLTAGFQPYKQTVQEKYYKDILDEETGEPTGDKETSALYRDIEKITPGATEGFTFDPSKVTTFQTTLQDLYQGTGDIKDEAGNVIGKDRGLRGERFEYNVGKAYQDLFNRAATEEEIADALEGYDAGSYREPGSFRSNLKESDAYLKKFNDNYMDNYYDLMYGSSVADRTDAEGNVTKLRKFNFDKELLPTFKGKELLDDEGKGTGKFEPSPLEIRTGIQGQDYTTYFNKERSVAELEEGLQSLRQTRDFMYNAGLANLEGEIQKENNRIMIEGRRDLAKIDQATEMYKLINFQF